MSDLPDELYTDANISWQNAQMVMREICKIQYLENFRVMAPMIVAELKKYGVVFTKERRTHG